MGCDYARWCHSISGDRSIYWPKGRVSCCSGWKKSVMCAFLNCYFCCGGNGGGTVTCWNVSPIGDHNRLGVICPFGYGCIDALNEICLGGIVFLREESCWGKSYTKWPNSSQSYQCASGQRQPKWPVHPQTKHLSLLDIIMTMQGISVAVSLSAVCTEPFNQSDASSQSLGVLLIHFSSDGGCILKSLNKNADCCSVIVKSTFIAAVLKQWM